MSKKLEKLSKRGSFFMFQLVINEFDEGKIIIVAIKLDGLEARRVMIFEI